MTIYASLGEDALIHSMNEVSCTMINSLTAVVFNVCMSVCFIISCQPVKVPFSLPSRLFTLVDDEYFTIVHLDDCLFICFFSVENLKYLCRPKFQL